MAMPPLLAASPAWPVDRGRPDHQPLTLGLRPFRRWANTPTGGVILLILTTLLARLVFAASLGLGMDESYMVAAGRQLHLSYFDHPPLAWWMAWVGAHALGTDAAWAVRLPFVLTFAASTWMMFRLTARLFNPCAGLWAAALLNAAPVLGVTTGAWVLPDGPLDAALLGAALCVAHIFAAAPAAQPEQPRAAWGWWLGAGLCAGLALLSKYSAALSIAGAILFLLTTAPGRFWLRRSQPYVAGVVALAVFSPVLVWNAGHGWISLVFQIGRAGIGRLHPFGPLSTFGGEAIFLLPWIWLPLVAVAVARARSGPRDLSAWLMLCLAVPPIALFGVLSVWTHVLFHWAAPGYLMLFPLLGDAVGLRRRRSRPVRVWLAATVIFVTTGVALVASEVRFNWLSKVGENFAPGRDPDLAAVNWTSIANELSASGLLARPGLVIGATRWFYAGKIDYALGGRVRVTCLGPDPREFGLINPSADILGHDVLLIVPHGSIQQIRSQFGAVFTFIEPLPPLVLLHAGRPAMLIPIFLGHHMQAHPIERPSI